MGQGHPPPLIAGARLRRRNTASADGAGPDTGPDSGQRPRRRRAVPDPGPDWHRRWPPATRVRLSLLSRRAAATARRPSSESPRRHRHRGGERPAPSTRRSQSPPAAIGELVCRQTLKVGQLRVELGVDRLQRPELPRPSLSDHLELLGRHQFVRRAGPVVLGRLCSFAGGERLLQHHPTESPDAARGLLGVGVRRHFIQRLVVLLLRKVRPAM